MKVRRRARIAALQALFEVDTVHHDAGTALQGRLDEAPLPGPGVEFSSELLRGVLQYQAELDRVIQKIAPEWPIEQMAPIDRNILRLAAYEIIHDDSTPPKVVINEAVELAKIFGSDSSSRFVNGVLGTLLSQRHELASSLSTPSSQSNNGSNGDQSDLIDGEETPQSRRST